MIKKSLSFKMRPSSLDEIYGQEELTNKDGFIYKMLENEQLFNLIITGPPGTGKTSIANIIALKFSLKSYIFNASTDSKQILKELKDEISLGANFVLIVDEIHRLKKDTQDFLLPLIESNDITLIGLTTENPYYSINPALRSRCHIISLKPLNSSDILKILYNALDKDLLNNQTLITEEALKYIVSLSNNDARAALNMLELVEFQYNHLDKITLNDAKKLFLKPNLPLDKDDANYYQLLSALQKSIRGSDANASIHYLARLLVLGDLQSLTRRLIVIAYEDISLGNPQLLQRVVIACEASLKVGLPEANIILASIVIDMALSPKSNSTYIAINKAIEDFQNGNYSDVPFNLINNNIKYNNAVYLYPHDYTEDFVEQNYMPLKIIDTKYYFPKENSAYEKALKERYKYIEKRLDIAKNKVKNKL